MYFTDFILKQRFKKAFSQDHQCIIAAAEVCIHIKKELEAFAAKKDKLEGNPSTCSYSQRESLGIDCKTNCFICENQEKLKESGPGCHCY